jgi:hypothetical protein
MELPNSPTYLSITCNLFWKAIFVLILFYSWLWVSFSFQELSIEVKESPENKVISLF